LRRKTDVSDLLPRDTVGALTSSNKTSRFNGSGAEVLVRGRLPYFFSVETLGLEFKRLRTLVNAVPGGEAMAELKDADEARGNNMDGEALAVEKDSNEPLGTTTGEEQISDAWLAEAMDKKKLSGAPGAATAEEKDFDASPGDITDERARFRLRWRSTGGRPAGIAITQNWTQTPERRIRKKRANTDCI
jgi:hypothetical protein